MLIKIGQGEAIRSSPRDLSILNGGTIDTAPENKYYEQNSSTSVENYPLIDCTKDETNVCTVTTKQSRECTVAFQDSTYKSDDRALQLRVQRDQAIELIPFPRIQSGSKSNKLAPPGSLQQPTGHSFKSQEETFDITNRATQNLLLISNTLRRVEGKEQLRVSENINLKYQGGSLATHFTILGDRAAMGVQQTLVDPNGGTQDVEGHLNKGKIPEYSHQ